MFQTWGQVLASAQAAGAALVSSTTPTSIIPAPAKFTLPANYFDHVGQSLLIKAQGTIQNQATPGSLTLDIRFGATVVFTSGAMAMNATATGPFAYDLELLLTCRAVGQGTNANLMGIGKFTSYSGIGGTTPSTGVPATILLPYNAAPAIGTGFDSTVSQAVDHFATWATSSATNSIQVQNYTLISLN